MKNCSQLEIFFFGFQKDWKIQLPSQRKLGLCGKSPASEDEEEEEKTVSGFKASNREYSLPVKIMGYYYMGEKK